MSFKVLNNINLNNLISLMDKGDKILKLYRIKQFEEIIIKDIIISESSFLIIRIELIVTLK